MSPTTAEPAPSPSGAEHAIPGWATDAIIRAGRRMDARGWVPATAGNLSVRLGADHAAVTCSGNHKGFLQPGDVMPVSLDGTPLGPGRPSAETALHLQLYRLFPAVGAVLHGHSVAATVLSRLGEDEAAIRFVRFRGDEVQKIFPGQTTHEATVELPVVANDQDIPRLAAAIAPRLHAETPGYLIQGHGVYVWGADMDVALARLEGLEFLLACELERRRLSR